MRRGDPSADGFEVRDGMRIEWDCALRMDDGVVLRGDLFLPLPVARYPVILSCGPYGKGLAFQDGHFQAIWTMMTAAHPETGAASSNRYQVWELVDPERWTRDGYAVLRVDCRGMGRSPGLFDAFSPRHTADYFECIEWAGVQAWSSGKVGLCGISWYAINQWHVASLQPPHLTALCAWEGAADAYRDFGYHGGILQTFWRLLTNLQLLPVQHGIGERGFRSCLTGELVAGPQTLSAEILAENRRDFFLDQREHPLDDEFHTQRSPVWENVRVPFLSCGNWGGQGLHLRGNTEAFVRASSSEKWLEIHGLEHWTHFYTDYGYDLQKRFFDCFLKGIDNGWRESARVRLQVRHVGNRFVERLEHEWPVARTEWTKFYLNPDGMRLSKTELNEARQISYAALGDGITFLSDPLMHETEITGPAAAKLFISSSTRDADIFLVIRVFAPDLKEHVFLGANDPLTPVSLGWLRMSHRKLDPALSKDYRPYHSHDEEWPIRPGEVVECEVEIWPTSIVVPVGHLIGASIRGRDYVAQAARPTPIGQLRPEPNGVGPIFHNDPEDRPIDVFGGENTVHCGLGSQSYLLLPIIPKRLEAL